MRNPPPSTARQRVVPQALKDALRFLPLNGGWHPMRKQAVLAPALAYLQSKGYVDISDHGIGYRRIKLVRVRLTESGVALREKLEKAT